MLTQSIPLVSSSAFSTSAGQTLQLRDCSAPNTFVCQRVRISLKLVLSDAASNSAFIFASFADFAAILNGVFGSSIGLTLNGSDSIVRPGTNPGNLASLIMLAHRRAPMDGLRIGVSYSQQTTDQVTLYVSFTIPVDYLADCRLAGLQGFQFGAAKASGELVWGASAATMVVGSSTRTLDTTNSRFKVDLVGVDPGVPVRANPLRYQLDTFGDLGNSKNLATGVCVAAVGFIGEYAAAAGRLVAADCGLDYQQDGQLVQTTAYFDPFIAMTEWSDDANEIGRLVADISSLGANGNVLTGYGTAVTGVDGEGTGFLPVIPLFTMPSAAGLDALRVIRNNHTFKVNAASTTAYGTSLQVGQVFLKPTSSAGCLDNNGNTIAWKAGNLAWTATGRLDSETVSRADPDIMSYLSQVAA